MVEPLVLLPLSVSPTRLVRPAEDGLRRLAGRSMGTHWSLNIAGKVDPAIVAALVQAELDAVVAEMSQWDNGSELSRFNAAEAGAWRKLSPGFFDVLTEGLHIAQRTQGAFDPTLGAVVDLWGFGPGTPTRLPPQADKLAEARAASGWEKLALDTSSRLARQPGGLKLDLSGIAKGHAADRAARRLEDEGHVSFLMEIGGELVARGLKPDGQPWWVDLEQPPQADLPPIRIGLVHMAVATSGDYRRYHDLGAHTLDPRTAAPLRDAPASVTVLHETCMSADASATALTVLGVEAGLAFAEEEQLAAIFMHQHDGAWRQALSSRARAMADA